MKSSSRLAVALLVASCIGPRVTNATTFVAMSERALARAADAIVVGTIVDLETVADRSGAISTLVTIDVDATYKGAARGRIVLKQPGGDLDDRGLFIPGSPVFERGDRNLLFLSAARDGSARTTALGLGQFRLGRDPSGDEIAERVVTEPVIGGHRARRLKLGRLLRTIGKAVRLDAGRAVAPLVAIPDEVTAPGLERVVTAPFTFMEPQRGRWHEPDLGETVEYGVDAAGDPALGAAASFAAVDAALAAWTDVDGATITLARGAAAAPMPLLCDGLSQIVFGDPFDEMPKPVGCSGILALGGYCTKGRSAAETDVVNGVRFRRIAEGNITFNSGFGSCSFWNVANLAEVATHEIGHTIGIGHSSESDDEQIPALKDATMYYRAHFDGRSAGLRADDVAAVRAIYPGARTGVTDDVDGDGIPDTEDNCPGDDPMLGLANPSQTDSDGDAMGDLCDACPLVPAVDGVQVCQPIVDSTMRVAESSGRLVWRGLVQIDGNADLGAVRVVLTAGQGVLVDTAETSSELRRVRRSRNRLVYKSDIAVVQLRRARRGRYQVRTVVRTVALGPDAMPVVSASLQVGTSAFSASLSCLSRGGRRLACRG